MGVKAPQPRPEARIMRQARPALAAHAGFRDPERRSGLIAPVAVERMGKGKPIRLVNVAARAVQPRESLEMIHPVEIVRADQGPRVMGADDARLVHGIINFRVAVKAATIQNPARRMDEAGITQGHLFPIAVIHAPEGVAPGAVQFRQRAIPFPQPCAEPGLAMGAMAVAENRTADFIVNLPGHDIRVARRCAGKFFRNPGAMPAIDGGGIAGVLAHAMIGRPAVLADDQGLGVVFHQPRRRRRRGRAQHDIDLVIGHDAEGRMQPIQREVVFAGLHARPGELADPDHVDARRPHQPGIGLQIFQSPVFRIISTTIILHNYVLRAFI